MLRLVMIDSHAVDLIYVLVTVESITSKIDGSCAMDRIVLLKKRIEFATNRVGLILFWSSKPSRESANRESYFLPRHVKAISPCIIWLYAWQ